MCVEGVVSSCHGLWVGPFQLYIGGISCPSQELSEDIWVGGGDEQVPLRRKSDKVDHEDHLWETKLK